MPVLGVGEGHGHRFCGADAAPALDPESRRNPFASADRGYLPARGWRRAAPISSPAGFTCGTEAGCGPRHRPRSRDRGAPMVDSGIFLFPRSLSPPSGRGDERQGYCLYRALGIRQRDLEAAPAVPTQLRLLRRAGGMVVGPWAGAASWTSRMDLMALLLAAEDRGLGATGSAPRRTAGRCIGSGFAGRNGCVCGVASAGRIAHPEEQRPRHADLPALQLSRLLEGGSG